MITPQHCPFKVESLEVWRGESCLFSELDFELGDGQAALVTGANGSGKTTFLRILAGMTLPASGAVTWLGTPVHRLDPLQRADIAYQGHLNGLKKELTVVENMTFDRRFWNGGQEPEEPLEELLEELRLNECRDRQVRYLSAGQRCRAALGCMRLKPAKLWLLDEPLTNLDGRGAELVAGWVTAHTAAGGLAVVATHQREQLVQTASVEIEL